MKKTVLSFFMFGLMICFNSCFINGIANKGIDALRFDKIEQPATISVEINNEVAIYQININGTYPNEYFLPNGLPKYDEVISQAKASLSQYGFEIVTNNAQYTLYINSIIYDERCYQECKQNCFLLNDLEVRLSSLLIDNQKLIGVDLLSVASVSTKIIEGVIIKGEREKDYIDGNIKLLERSLDKISGKVAKSINKNELIPKDLQIAQIEAEKATQLNELLVETQLEEERDFLNSLTHRWVCTQFIENNVLYDLPQSMEISLFSQGRFYANFPEDVEVLGVWEVDNSVLTLEGDDVYTFEISSINENELRLKQKNHPILYIFTRE